MNAKMQFNDDHVRSTSESESDGFRFYVTFTMTEAGIFAEVYCQKVEMDLDSLSETRQFGWNESNQALQWANNLKLDITRGYVVLN